MRRSRLTPVARGEVTAIAGGDYDLFVHYLYSIAYMSDELYQHADLQLPPDQVLPHRRLRGLDEHQLPEDLHLW